MILASLALDERFLGFPSRDALTARAVVKPTARFTLSNTRATILHTEPLFAGRTEFKRELAVVVAIIKAKHIFARSTGDRAAIAFAAKTPTTCTGRQNVAIRTIPWEGIDIHTIMATALFVVSTEPARLNTAF